MERDWIGIITAISKKMALRYGVVNITDIRLNPANDGIEFVLDGGEVVNVLFTSSEMPFNGAISDIDVNNVQDAIDEIYALKANINNPTFTGAVKVADGNTTDFPLAKTISGLDSGHTFAGNAGIIGETVSGGANTYGVGVGGVCKGTSDDLSIGVFGRALPNATGDTVDCRGVQGTSSATHTGGKNIGVFGSASGGAKNYSFYGTADANLSAGNKYLINDVDVLALKSDLINTSIMLYVDGINGNDTTGDATIAKPVKTLSKLVEIMNDSTATGFSIYIAYATYAEDGDLLLVDKPIKIYGNMATITNSEHTITIQNPNFYCNDLNVTGNITFGGTSGGRVLCDNVAFVGNIVCNGFTDFTTANISGGTIANNETATLYLRGSINNNQIISTGNLTIQDTNMIFGINGDYLVKSTAGVINIVNAQIINTIYASRQYAIYCNNNGSAVTPNILANVNLTVYGVVNSGTAYTSFTSGSVIFSADSFAVSSHLTPVPLAIAIAYMMLGGDATGDLYINVNGVFARLPIGTEGQVLAVSAGGLPYWKTLS